MRLAPLSLAVLALAACDGTEVAPGDTTPPLVGTWALTEIVSETRVESRVDQSVPDLSAQGEGGIMLSGAVSAQLRYVWTVDRQHEGSRGVVFGTTHGVPEADVPFVTMGLRWGSLAGATVNWLPQGTDAPEIRYDAEIDRAVEYADGRFTVPAVTLRADDGAEVRAEGSLTLPLVALAAGREVTVETGRRTPRERALTFTAAGSFAESAGDEPSMIAGTWVTDDNGGLELWFGGQPPDHRFQPRVTYQIDRGTLRLVRSYDAGCTGECVPAYAANHYVAPESIERVRQVETETYRRVR